MVYVVPTQRSRRARYSESRYTEHNIIEWLFKLLTTEGTWQQLIHNKYLRAKPLSQAFWKHGDSFLGGSHKGEK
jgi:hypothetical protein